MEGQRAVPAVEPSNEVPCGGTLEDITLVSNDDTCVEGRLEKITLDIPTTVLGGICSSLNCHVSDIYARIR